MNKMELRKNEMASLTFISSNSYFEDALGVGQCESVWLSVGQCQSVWISVGWCIWSNMALCRSVLLSAGLCGLVWISVDQCQLVYMV